MKLLLLDNYDSFTYNLVHLIEQFTEQVDVIRNDKLQLRTVEQYDKIILSPGHGLPRDAGIMMDIIKTYAATKSILGVCLGMQGIAEFFGASLLNLSEVFHGIETKIKVTDKKEILFKDIPSVFTAGRYHSWTVNNQSFPSCLKVTAVDSKGIIMAIMHTLYDVKGVQFHPESIMTEYGKKFIQNWIEKK